MSDYFTPSGNPTTRSAAASSIIRAIATAIEAGFNKIAGYTGNAGKIVAINGAGTAQEAITTTGTGNGVRATSPTLTTPNLGTPSTLVGTNITGTAASLTAGAATLAATATAVAVGGVSGLGAGVATFLATPSSSNLKAALTDETGSGAAVFAEEGTWTPGISFGGGSTGVTYDVHEGEYVKVGKLVTANFVMMLTSKGSSTGEASVTGLPFAASNTLVFGCSGGGIANVFSGLLENAYGPLVLKVNGSATTCAIKKGTASGTFNEAASNSSVDDAFLLQATISYIASA